MADSGDPPPLSPATGRAVSPSAAAVERRNLRRAQVVELLEELHQLRATQVSGRLWPFSRHPLRFAGKRGVL